MYCFLVRLFWSIRSLFFFKSEKYFGGYIIIPIIILYALLYVYHF
jgi:hypothetical protein